MRYLDPDVKSALLSGTESGMVTKEVKTIRDDAGNMTKKSVVPVTQHISRAATKAESPPELESIHWKLEVWGQKDEAKWSLPRTLRCLGSRKMAVGGLSACPGFLRQ